MAKIAPQFAALLLAAGADPGPALEDAGAMGSEEVREVLQAASAGESHPLIEEAAVKVEEAQIDVGSRRESSYGGP